MAPLLIERINLFPTWQPKNSFQLKRCTRFSTQQLQSLLQEGYTEHAFPNARSLLFTLQEKRTFRDRHTLHLRALDLRGGKFVFAGVCEFTVDLGKIPEAKIQFMDLTLDLPPYNPALCDLIIERLQLGLADVKQLNKEYRLHSFPEQWRCFPRRSDFAEISRKYPNYIGGTGLWIKEKYRYRNSPSFIGLANLLFGTAVIITKGLGFDWFEIWVGNCHTRLGEEGMKWYRRTQKYYAGQFGAVVDDDGYGVMTIDLR